MYERVNDLIRACHQEMQTGGDLALPDNNLVYYNLSTSVDTFDPMFVEALAKALGRNVG